MSNELKPCPFCGGVAEQYQFRANEYTVRCRRCKADCGGWEHPFRAEYVWNHRAAENALAPQFVSLKLELIQKKATLLAILNWCDGCRSKYKRKQDLKDVILCIGKLAKDELNAPAKEEEK